MGDEASRGSRIAWVGIALTALVLLVKTVVVVVQNEARTSALEKTVVELREEVRIVHEDIKRLIK